MTAAAAVRFGPFDLFEPLGGGMGIVYRARRRGDDVDLAVKLLREERLHDGDARARFRREAAAMNSLSHPAICPLLEAGDVDGMPYLCMPLLRGQSLAAHLRQAREHGTTLAATLPGHAATTAAWRPVLAVAATVADALALAHRSGFVHRDVKPSNLWIDPHGAPLLLDFGLTRAPGERDRDLTRSGQIVGTPSYMAPEQLDARIGPVGPLADVYGLAAVVYECLTLVPPFRGTTRSQLFANILAGTWTPPTQHVPDLPADVTALLALALQRRPARRRLAAADFAAAARALLADRPLPAHCRLRRPSRVAWLAAGAAAIAVTAALASHPAVWADARTTAAAAELASARRTHAALPPALPQHLPTLRAWLDGHGRERRPAARDGAAAGDPFADWAVRNVERRVAAAATDCAQDHAAAWAAMRADLARAPRFGGFVLPALPDLVPLGNDPDSGLPEFHHPASAAPGIAPPRRDERGRLVLQPGHGIVFVLLPGGVVATPGAPARPVTPFLLAKHELTRAQYERLDPGRDPSDVPLGETWNGELHTRQHPVNQLQFAELVPLLAGFALALPSHAQWMHAAGAGSEVAAPPAGNHAGDDDGWHRAAPVGSYAANAFGLFDMFGNVAEPVADGGRPPRAGSTVPRYTLCGGSYGSRPWTLDGTALQELDQRSGTIGVRVVRPLETP